jgi:hypothetical protein
VTEHDITAANAPWPVGEVRYNSFTWSKHWECDATLWLTDGRMIEVEWKNNFEDFTIDFFKNAGGYSRKLAKRRPRRTRVADASVIYKHDLLASRDVPIHGYYFACPAGVIPRDKVPSYAGLIYMYTDLFGEVTLDVVRNAPPLGVTMKQEFLFK